jgi:hypothetical protein
MGYNLYKVGGFCMAVYPKPIKCYSSVGTFYLLHWRNSEKRLEQMMLGEERVNHYFIHIGKILVTEVGSVGLALTSGVEWVGYAILYFGSLFRTPSTREYYNDLCNSSRFTLLWNLANFVFFNWYCTHLFPLEAFARYAIDYVHGGPIATIAAVTTVVALTVLSLREKWDIFGYLARRNWIYALPAFMLLKNLHHLFSQSQIRDKDLRWLAAVMPEEKCSTQSLTGRILSKLRDEVIQIKVWEKVIDDFFDNCKSDVGFAELLKKGDRWKIQKLVVMRNLFVRMKGEEVKVEVYKHRTVEVIAECAKNSLTEGQKISLNNHFTKYPPKPDASKGVCHTILSALELQALEYIDKPLFQQAWRWVCKEKGYL